jgi:hypothetical protein
VWQSRIAPYAGLVPAMMLADKVHIAEPKIKSGAAKPCA